MIDAIWFVFWVLIVPCGIVGLLDYLWSMHRGSRFKVRGATRLSPHARALRWERAEWERRRRDRQGV